MKKTIGIFLLILIMTTGFYSMFGHQPQPFIATPSAPAYDKYDYGSSDEARIIDVATQPNAIFTSESLFHDRILQRQLAARGWVLRKHPFRNGIEMLPYTDGRLDLMILGDIPAFIAMNRNRIGIFAVCRQGYNTVIAGRSLTPSELKGLRVGYPPNTTAHFAIDRTLNSAGLSINDIISVPMPPDEMESALRSHKVDAIVSWEPTASSILAIPGSSAISVSEGFSYISVDLEFGARHPDLKNALLAAVVRATKWAKLDERNVCANLLWDRDAATDFFGKSPVEANAKWISLMRKETIDNPSFPMLPINFGAADGLQHQQFEFLKKNGILPANADWNGVCARADTKLLPEIISDGKTWQIDSFDYAPNDLYSRKEGSR